MKQELLDDLQRLLKCPKPKTECADRALLDGAEAYTYLGTANYVKHTGSRPMNITWQLDRPIPAKFLKKTNKLVVG